MTIKKLTAIVLTGALVLLTACSDSDSGSGKKSKKKDYYTIGETWTVDGQWSLTITGVTETTERNEYADEKPAAVYIVDYEYTNIGYEDEDGIAKGIFFDMEDTIIDSNGVMGYSYPGDVARNPNEAPIGSTCKAQACIGVDNAGDFRITESHYDSDGDEHSATFLIEVGGRYFCRAWRRFQHGFYISGAGKHHRCRERRRVSEHKDRLLHHGHTEHRHA